MWLKALNLPSVGVAVRWGDSVAKVILSKGVAVRYLPSVVSGCGV